MRCDEDAKLMRLKYYESDTSENMAFPIGVAWRFASFTRAGMPGMHAGGGKGATAAGSSTQQRESSDIVDYVTRTL